MMWSQVTVDEWRSCVDGVVTVDGCSQWINGGWRSCVDGVVTVHSG